ncbi:hypothetical protein LCGC14_0474670 [marine sediment metagenome]|uniref:Uncharacterized protein n=1 Tax=marine sediment metagenome TaxID=412755 RepID=A0A0F9SU73_9ZZZZ
MPKNAKGEEITQEQFDALSPEDKAEATKVPGPAPEIQAKDIVGLKELMTESLTEFAASAVQPVVEPTDTVIVQPTDTVDPLTQALDSHTGPKFAQQDIEIANAKDSGLFYSTHPECIKHQEAIENGVQNLISQGKPFTRQAVWEWYRGSQENFDGFVKEAMETEKTKVKEAEDAQTVDAAGRPVIQSPTVDHTNTEEEVSKAMENVEF